MRHGHPQLRVIRWLVWSLVVIGIVVGCRSTPKQEINDYNLSAPPTATMEDISRAITSAGASLGWQISKIGPGELQGTLNVRKHQAVVTITHDTQVFSINYKDSRNLKYDGVSIHRNYNTWVSRLAQRIQAQASAL